MSGTPLARPILVVGDRKGEVGRRDAFDTIDWPRRDWLPLRRAAFDLYCRHRVSKGLGAVAWETNLTEGDTRRLRLIGVDFDRWHVFLVLDVVSQAGEVQRFEFNAEDLARGLDHTAQMLEHQLHGDDLKLAQNWIFSHWHTMTRHVFVAVSAAMVTLYARIGSAAADFARIPPDMFAHYKVTDWLDGVAISPHGPPLISPHLDLDSAGQYLDQPNLLEVDYVAQKRASIRKRPRRIFDYTFEYIKKNFPNGTPPNMTLKMLAREVSGERRPQATALRGCGT